MYISELFITTLQIAQEIGEKNQKYLSSNDPSLSNQEESQSENSAKKKVQEKMMSERDVNYNIKSMMPEYFGSLEGSLISEGLNSFAKKEEDSSDNYERNSDGVVSSSDSILNKKNKEMTEGGHLGTINLGPAMENETNPEMNPNAIEKETYPEINSNGSISAGIYLLSLVKLLPKRFH